MKAYGYDENGYYTNEVDCPIDPLETQKAGHEVYILPANATYLEPLEAKDGFNVRFVDNMWIYEAIPEPEPEPEPEPHVPTKEEQEQKRAWAYREQIDPLHSQKTRRTILGTWTEEDEAEYTQKVITLSEEIAQTYPYPTDPII